MTFKNREKSIPMNSHQQKDHIIMFPFMAQGHIIPFLALAKFITRRSPTTKITLVSTPLNIQYIHSTLSSSPQTTTNIHLAELPLSSSDHGLPPNSENTDSLPPHLFSTLVLASGSLQPSFHNLITDIIENDKCLSLCIISDIFTSWTIDVATSVGIPHFSFTTCGGYGTAAYFSVWSNLPHRNPTGGINDEFHPPGFPENTLFHVSQLPIYLREDNFINPFAKFFQKQISHSLKSDGMFCNTVEEIEVLGLEILRKMMKSKPVWAIGPLLPPFLLNNVNSSNSKVVSELRTGKELGISQESCIEWLDHQEQSSVLYISFGSQNTINSLQMKELAVGIEESGKSFIWVLRPPKEFDIKSEFKSEWLPEGFEERIRESKKGLLVKKWAPQLEILSHKSTGGFLSHCGWNSILESLSQGVPIIGWPLAAEQAYNSKMMEEEMGVCVELARGIDGKIVSKKVKRVIELVMGVEEEEEGKGKEMRRKALVIAEKIRASVREDNKQKGSSIKAIDEFVGLFTKKTEKVV